MNQVVIKRCPSWSKISAMMGEWARFEHRSSPLAPSRAAEIAAHMMAASHCKRMGKPMTKDWTKVHPSMPYQVGALAERIAAHQILAGQNNPATYWIEVGGD